MSTYYTMEGREFKGAKLEVKDVNESKGIVTFQFGAFDNVDRDGDIIRSKAYTKTLKEREQSIKHFKNHDPSENIGKILNIWTDEKGIYAESQLILENPLGMVTFNEYKHGCIDQHSQGFYTVKSNPIDGTHGREITEVALLEASTLSFLAANPDTPMLGLKSGITIQQINAFLPRFEKMVSEGNHHDVTGKQLEQLLINIKSLLPLLEPGNHSGKANEPVFDISKLKQEFKNLT